MTIGVIADTHIHWRHGSHMLPEPVVNVLIRAKPDLIVHLGDVNTRSVLDDLAEIAPLIAVVGNNDDDELQFMLKHSVKFTAGKFSFAAVHGHGGASARAVATERFAGKVDCVLFGHSHKPLIENVAGSILFNPGSPTDRRWFEHFGIGLIQVTANQIKPELILFAKPDHLDNVDV